MGYLLRVGFGICLATSCSVARSAIIYTDFRAAPITVVSGSPISVDMDTAQAGTSVPGNDLFLAYGSFSVENPSVQSNPADTSIAAVPASPGNVLRLNYGDSFTSASFVAWGGFLDNGSYGGFWDATSGEAYVGVRKGGNEGWLRIFYDDSADVFQLTGIAYNQSGTLTAGQTTQIPEPGTAGLFGAFVALGMASVLRRRVS